MATRYQREVIRICISKKNRQYNGHKIPKGGNQNLYIEEEQTIQWPQVKVQKDKQRSIKHTQKTKDRVTQTPLKTGGDLKSFGGISSSCSTSGTHRVNLDLNV